MSKKIFNPPPDWPKPPAGWSPPLGWEPDPSWPALAEGWELWKEEAQDESTSQEARHDAEEEKEDSAGDGVEILKLEINALKRKLEGKFRPESSHELNDDLVLREVGIYRYHHPLEDAAAYKERLKVIDSRIVEMVREKAAIKMSELFTYDNSLAKGRKMASDLGSLMLRAYNSEVENCLRSLRAGNLLIAKKRVQRSRDAISKLGGMMEMQINQSYHDLRIEEIELTADYLMKKQEEREAAKEERARLREEKKIAAEIALEREELDKEKQHLVNMIAALKDQGESDSNLEERLKSIDEAICKNDFRAANIRAGYVYIISNRGAFGEGIVKIGLTRRLEPEQRIDELSGASVPFRFDVHALFFSEDAVALERELHQHFSERRLNHANPRKEFFFATPLEVKNVLQEKVGNLLEFHEHMDSEDYLQSLSYWPERAYP